MIVRILSEGQYEVPDDLRGRLDELDDALVEAVNAGDEGRFENALAAVIGEVRGAGTALPDDEFAPSELVLPFADATVEETKRLLSQSAETASPNDP